MGASTPTRGETATTSTLVSLYAALLGFFIALTAMSEPAADARRAALTGLQGSFGGGIDIIPAIDEPGFNAAPERGAPAVEILAEALNSEISGSGEGEVVRIDIPMAGLFAPQSVRLRGDRMPALKRAIHALAPSSARLELALTPEDDADGLNRERLVILAERLSGFGLAAERLRLTILPERGPARLTFIFHNGEP